MAAFGCAGLARSPLRRSNATRTSRLWIYMRDDRPFGGVGLLRPHGRNRGKRAASAPAEPRRAAVGVLIFRALSWSARPRSSWASSTPSRLASVRRRCSNGLYPARATRNKINGLRESASWMGLLAPQPYPSKSLKISENFLGAERIGSAAARDCASSRDAAAGRPPQQGRSRSERARR